MSRPRPNPELPDPSDGYDLARAISALSEHDLSWNVVLITAASTPYQVLPDEDLILVDATLGPVTVTLPPLTITVPVGGWQEGAWRRPYYVKKVDAGANAVTVAGSGAETIEGAGSVALAAQWNYVAVLPVVGIITDEWVVVANDP